MRKPKIISCLLASALALFAAGGRAAAADNYWKLGVGSYGIHVTGRGFTILDRARMDWVLVCFGNPPGPDRAADKLNEMLRINPDLKIMVRIWPIDNLGWPENRHQASFLDYFYRPGTRERLLQRAGDQVRSVLDRVDRPENVVGFTFLEELPLHFGRSSVWDLRNVEEEVIPPIMERYRAEIEAERGKPLAWDNETRRWAGLKFARALNEINAHIKAESGGRLVFVWLQVNHATLDFRPEGVAARGGQPVLPFYFSEIIGEGTADGFFAYPNNSYIWERYRALARENGWLFFSQLSHPSGMRLGPWEESLALARTRDPRNLGYFFYCSGSCRTGEWLDDHASPVDDNFGRPSQANHYRRHCAEQGVGMEIIARELRPEVTLNYDSERERSVFGNFMPLRVLVRNPRDETWFPDGEGAVLRNVRVDIALPGGYELEADVSAPRTIVLGDIEAEGYRSALWWATLNTAAPIGAETPLAVTVSADNAPEVTIVSTDGRRDILPEPFHEVTASGDRFLYPGLHGHGPALVRLECVGDQATRPALTVGANRISWHGNLARGETLEIAPGRRARLISAEHPEGRDVSDRLFGRDIVIYRRVDNRVIYEDDDMPSGAVKVRVTIETGTGN